MSDFDEHEFELSGTGIELRTAGGDDQDLIRRIVTLTTYWRTDDMPHELPESVEKYYAGWGDPATRRHRRVLVSRHRVRGRSSCAPVRPGRRCLWLHRR